MVKHKGLERAVTFLGQRDDVASILHGSDIFVYSVKREEGLGIALIEAMAAGLPVVASDVPACREVLDDGALGLLVPPKDPAALAAGIRRVIDEPETARRRAEKARDKAKRVFSAEAMARRYAEVLGL